MKYSEDIIKQILSELEKVPNVRYVCSKVGIDHSTFYRWLMKFPTLNKQVMASTIMGKQAICSTAEAVIIKGVQNGDFKACTFFLSHNDSNYMSKEKGTFFAELYQNKLNYTSAKTKLDGSNFESLFTFLDKITATQDEKTSAELKDMTIGLFCDYDPDLIELYHKSYEYWKMQKILENAVEEAFKPSPEEITKKETLTSPPNPSSIKKWEHMQYPTWGKNQEPPQEPPKK